MTQPAKPDVRELMERLENYYAFECEGGPLKLCVDWQALRRHIEQMEGELAELRQAVGLMTTMKGDLEMDSLHPLAQEQKE